MGLSIEVGILADLKENDPEGGDHFRNEFQQLNRYLKKLGLPEHNEPETCDVWSCDMYGYSGLHYLRRIAAHYDLKTTLPPPGDTQSTDDPVLREYYGDFERPKDGVIGKLFGAKRRKRSYDHLIIHSDAEGYYIPLEFDEVLIPGKDFPITGGIVGSSHRLLSECERLAEFIGLPLDIGEESEELWKAVESQGEGDTQWKRYGVESFTCLRLYVAAQRSIETGAAIVFT
jgi:hypothetical protein